MDVRYINPFLAAAVHVLRTMAGIEATPGKPFVKGGTRALGDVSAIIGITGAAEGSMALTFSESCIKAVVKNLFQAPVHEIDDEVKDAVGELTNIICGDARKRLREEGLSSLKAGIPTIVTGKDHSIKHINNGPHLAVPFETEHGVFVVEVAFNKEKSRSKQY